MTEYGLGPTGFPLHLVWKDEAAEPLFVWAEYDADIRLYWLYWSDGIGAELQWFGDADDISEPESWVREIVEEVRCTCEHADRKASPGPNTGPGRVH